MTCPDPRHFERAHRDCAGCYPPTSTPAGWKAPNLTADELRGVRKDAEWVASNVGALGSPVRKRAECILVLVAEYEARHG